MKIVIGSLNQPKLDAVARHFSEATIVSESVPSDVSAQPIGDEETLIGAVNRAKNAQILHPHMLAVGLEGGVMYVAGTLYLTNWGALITPNGNVYTAAGGRIQLPEAFTAHIQAGVELSEIMDAYTKKSGIRHHEGAIGIFTNNDINRAAMFMHVVALLKGQMNYGENESL